jgi:hypothetical protein
MTTEEKQYPIGSKLMVQADELKLVNKKLGLSLPLYSKPWKNRNVWDEIWEKTGSLIANQYFANVLIELGCFVDNLGCPVNIGYVEAYQAHTAKPEICWKALIKTLK